MQSRYRDTSQVLSKVLKKFRSVKLYALWELCVECKKEIEERCSFPIQIDTFNHLPPMPSSGRNRRSSQLDDENTFSEICTSDCDCRFGKAFRKGEPFMFFPMDPKKTISSC